METFTLLLPIHQEGQCLPSTTMHRNQATQRLEDGSARGEAERAQPDQVGISRTTKGTWSFQLGSRCSQPSRKSIQRPN